MLVFSVYKMTAQINIRVLVSALKNIQVLLSAYQIDDLSGKGDLIDDVFDEGQIRGDIGQRDAVIELTRRGFVGQKRRCDFRQLVKDDRAETVRHAIVVLLRKILLQVHLVLSHLDEEKSVTVVIIFIMFGISFKLFIGFDRPSLIKV